VNTGKYVYFYFIITETAKLMGKVCLTKNIQFILYFQFNIESVPGRKVSILGGHSIGHSKQKSIYVHVFYSERCPR
jgi:hypothetical protein